MSVTHIVLVDVGSSLHQLCTDRQLLPTLGGFLNVPHRPRNLSGDLSLDCFGEVTLSSRIDHGGKGTSPTRVAISKVLDIDALSILIWGSVLLDRAIAASTLIAAMRYVRYERNGWWCFLTSVSPQLFGPVLNVVVSSSIFELEPAPGTTAPLILSAVPFPLRSLATTATFPWAETNGLARMAAMKSEADGPGIVDLVK